MMLGLGATLTPAPCGGNVYPGTCTERSVWIDLMPDGDVRSGLKLLLIAGAVWVLVGMSGGSK